jgi:ABC-2 type transport system permease protein
MLGVLTIGSDYGWDVVKTLFTQRPGRLAVLAGKLLALGVVLLIFAFAVLVGGAVTSYGIALAEDADVDWPSAWLLVRTWAAGWFILAVWAALGVLLAVLSRGTALAIGIAILYALVIEGLISALVGSVSAIEPLTEIFLRSNAYSIATALGASEERIADSGPGSFSGPYVGTVQAVIVLAAYLVAFVLVTAAVLRRRDVT